MISMKPEEELEVARNISLELQSKKKYLASDSEKEDVEEGCLENIGNTCYLNSTIQLLRDITKQGFVFKKNEEKYKDLFDLISSNDSNSSKLRNISINNFKGFDQQDPVELLNRIEPYLMSFQDLIYLERKTINDRRTPDNKSFLLSLEID